MIRSDWRGVHKSWAEA